MTINGVIYSRGSANGINTVKSYNRFGSTNEFTISAEQMGERNDLPDVVNLLDANATGAASGEWIDVVARAKPHNLAYYFIDGAGDGAYFALHYRPNANAVSSQIAASYTDITTEIIQVFEVLNGQYLSINSTGTSVNCMPQILFQNRIEH